MNYQRKDTNLLRNIAPEYIATFKGENDRANQGVIVVPSRPAMLIYYEV